MSVESAFCKPSGLQTHELLRHRVEGGAGVQTMAGGGPEPGALGPGAAPPAAGGSDPRRMGFAREIMGRPAAAGFGGLP